MNQEIEEPIRNFIASNLLYSKDGFNYPDDASLLREGIIDSLGVVELVEFLQTHFNVKVEQQEVRPDNFDSVAKMAAFVRRKTGRGLSAMRHRFLNLYQRYRIAKFRFLSDCPNVEGKPIMRQPVQFVGKGTIRFNGSVNLGFLSIALFSERLHLHGSARPRFDYPNRGRCLDEQ